MDNNSEVVYLYLDDIIPNRFQPREIFDDQALKELAVSIKEHGVIQPIIVRKVENKYEIIAGERRYKASTMAGLTKIPAIIKNLDDKESSKIALIENLQRKDLSPIEEARTYQKILELEGNMTQEELAATMGKTQSSVSNKLRLLDLPEEIQDALLKEKISERHARSLLTIEDKNDQIKMMDKVIAEKMTVRELEKEIKVMKGEVEGAKSEVAPVSNALPTLNLESNNTPANEAPEVTSTIPVISENTDNSNESSGGDVLKVDLPKPNLDEFTITPAIGNTNTSSVNQELSTPTVESTEPATQGTADSQEGAKPEKMTPESINDIFAKYFDSNIANKEENNNVASSIETPGITVPATTEAKDITKAIEDVKSTITTLQNSGYKVSFEESDNLNDYKISIQIDKN